MPLERGGHLIGAGLVFINANNADASRTAVAWVLTAVPSFGETPADLSGFHCRLTSPLVDEIVHETAPRRQMFIGTSQPGNICV